MFKCPCKKCDCYCKLLMNFCLWFCGTFQILQVSPIELGISYCHFLSQTRCTVLQHWQRQRGYLLSLSLQHFKFQLFTIIMKWKIHLFNNNRNSLLNVLYTEMVMRMILCLICFEFWNPHMITLKEESKNPNW